MPLCVVLCTYIRQKKRPDLYATHIGVIGPGTSLYDSKEIFFYEHSREWIVELDLVNPLLFGDLKYYQIHISAGFIEKNEPVREICDKIVNRVQEAQNMVYEIDTDLRPMLPCTCSNDLSNSISGMVLQSSRT